MKKIFLITLLSFTLLLNACGDNTETNSSDQSSDNVESTIEKVENKPLDLTGNWAEEDEESKEIYHAGYISGDRIEIFFISNEDNSSELYWSGTYEEPKKTTDEFTWDSNNDRTQTDLSLLGSGEDKKSFTYKDGKISYEVSLMGETRKAELVPSKTDYTSMGTVSESADTPNLQEVELVDSGYSILKDNGNITILYAVEISNPNEEYAIEFPNILITAKDEDGKILTTEEQTLNGIAAKDEYIYGNTLYYEGNPPTTVEISVENSDNNYLAQSSSDIIKSDVLAISNISENSGSSKTFTGEVTNNSSEELDTVAVIVIYKSGSDIVGGEPSYVDNLKAGKSKPFELSIYTDFTDYDSYEIYALQW